MDDPLNVNLDNSKGDRVSTRKLHPSYQVMHRGLSFVWMVAINKVHPRSTERTNDDRTTRCCTTTVPRPADFIDRVMEIQLTEAEFEKTMLQVRNVSSLAIKSAVSDAVAGDYASAIETLVTAELLIRQSKIGFHERCLMLVSGLHVTLRGLIKQQMKKI